MKIFVSSTFEDLRDHREAAIRTLRQLGHDVVAMEDFTASSAPPVERVLDLVRSCQAYVGIFAWRYGYVPLEGDIPRGLALPKGFVAGTTSITHLEYLQAMAHGKEILAFLVDETAAWSPQRMDAFVDAREVGEPGDVPGSRIRELRQSLKRSRIVAFFSSPADLEARVATAVTNLGLSLQLATNITFLTLPIPVNDSSAHGPIRNEVVSARKSEQRTVTIDLAAIGGWWSTRLYLLAALVDAFTDIARIVFVERSDRFVGTVSVRTVLERLALADPRLGMFSTELRTVLDKVADQDDALDAALKLWDTRIKDAKVHSTVTVPNLERWFGDALFSTPVEVRDLTKTTLLDLAQILSYPNDFVPVRTRQDAMSELERLSLRRQDRDWDAMPIVVVDKRALNDQLARRYVDELMERARLR